MASIEKFTTRGVTPVRRLDYWNRLCGETLAGTCVDSGSRSFRAEMWRWALGDLTMIRPRSEASVVHRPPLDGAGSGSIVLHFQNHGHSRHRQGACEVELGSGSFILSPAEEGYTFDLLTEHELLVVEMPRAALQARVPRLDEHLRRRIWGGQPSGRIFHDFLLSLWRQGDQSHADPHWQSGISNVFYDMLGLAIGGSDRTGQGMDAGTRPFRERLVELVELQLGDCELGTARLAAELGVSLRTVQNSFATMSATPSGYILERRMERAADMLRACRGTSITTIAYDLGFNDSAYFTRCFRQHFGMTPSQWRCEH